MVWIEKNGQTEKKIKRRACRFAMLVGTFLTFFVIVCFVLLLGVGCASAATIVVNQTSPANISGDFYCDTIQKAVDMAEDGDTIIVCPGTYMEKVEVDKSVSIRSYSGASDTVVEAYNASKSVFHLTANYVNISGFTIIGATKDYQAGIFIDGADCCNISANTASNSHRGIYLHSSSRNTLTKNMMSGNDCNFGVLGSSLSHFVQNIDTSNKINGKPIYYLVNQQNKHIPNDAGFVGIINSTNITVRGLTLRNNKQGVLLAYSKSSMIENVSTLSNDIGILAYFSSNNTIKDNIASNNSEGIYLRSSNNNTITNNTASSNDGEGIYLSSSSNNTLINSTALNNGYGIYLHSSSRNTLTKNMMSGNDCNFGVFGSSLSHFVQNIDTSNKVNGKPIYYLVNEQNKHIPNDAGFVGIINSTNITVRGLILRNNKQGVLLAYSKSSIIENVSTLSNDMGIFAYFSSNNTLKENIVSNNFWGIWLWSCSSNTLTNNKASKSTYGIYLTESLNNKITTNNASNNWDGIYLSSSSNNNSLISNTANLNSNGTGIRLDSSSNNTLSYNTVSTNYRGISLYFSRGNILINNNASSNNDYGICLFWSYDNKIYFNNFINNPGPIVSDITVSHNFWSLSSFNNWNSPEKIRYTYKGRRCKNYLGNYWDDYTGSDGDGDGIGDYPYNINSDKDNYPLMQPWQDYIV